MKSIAVFCGSSFGTEPYFIQQTQLLGKIMTETGIDLIYGGASVGLMGVVADAVLAAGGKVRGVLPEFLQTKEIAHDGLTELIIVGSMHDRKLKMNELADGVIALPGGFGTLEELFEMLTWAQLGLHTKPIALLNIDGYYDDLINFIKNMEQKGLLKETHQKMLLVSDNIEDLLTQMKAYQSPVVAKWLDDSKS